MNRLITDLLDLARIREGRVEIEVREEHTSELLAEATDQSAPLAEQRPVHLVNDGGPPGLVVCDRKRVLQVFDNIVRGAIEFSSPGDTVRLAVERRRTSAHSRSVTRGPVYRSSIFPSCSTGCGPHLGSTAGAALASALPSPAASSKLMAVAFWVEARPA